MAAMMFIWSEYHSLYSVVLLSLSPKACEGLTDNDVVHRSIAVLLPPLCQKSGTPSLLASLSSVGLGQKLPGSRPPWADGEPRTTRNAAATQLRNDPRERSDGNIGKQQ